MRYLKPIVLALVIILNIAIAHAEIRGQITVDISYKDGNFGIKDTNENPKAIPSREQGAGAYTLALLDSEGDILNRVSFNIYSSEITSSGTSRSDEVKLSPLRLPVPQENIQVKIPLNTEAKKIVIYPTLRPLDMGSLAEKEVDYSHLRRFDVKEESKPPPTKKEIATPTKPKPADIVPFILLALLIIMPILIKLYVHKSKKPKTKSIQHLQKAAHRDVNLPRKHLLNVQDYILKNREAGHSDKQIKERLIKSGWKKEHVDHAFDELIKVKK